VATHANRVPPFVETRNYVRLVRALYAIYTVPAATPTSRVKIRR